MTAPATRVLAGRRVAVTRAPEQARELMDLLRSRGAEPVPCPTIAVEPPASYVALDGALHALAQYDWAVFTSANAVAAFADRITATGAAVPRTLRVAAVGGATARALAERVRAPDFVPRDALAEALGRELEDVAGRRILFPRGDLAGDTLPGALRARGAAVDEVVAYCTVTGGGVTELARLVRAGELDAILFMSASSVRHVAGTLEPDGVRLPAVICIGPETARAAHESGVAVSAVATDRSATGVVEALERWLGREQDGERR